jgi:hypothetical protein
MMHGDIEPDPINERPRSTKQRIARPTGSIVTVSQVTMLVSVSGRLAPSLALRSASVSSLS